MTNPIHIDLRDLTDEMIEQALPHMGDCKYVSPCIIGTLLPPEKRIEFDSPNVPGIAFLIADKAVEFPDGQKDIACQLQSAFDYKDREGFDILIAEIRRLPPK